MIKRALESQIDGRFGKGKAILLIGPRQVGKTTLFNKLLENKEHLFLNGDDPTVRKLDLQQKSGHLVAGHAATF